MKALVIKQPWASLVAFGEKTVERRGWKTDYRGPVLIVAGAAPVSDGEEIMPHGVAVAVVMLECVVPFVAKEHAEMAAEEGAEDGGYAWVLGGAKEVHPVQIRGRRGLFDVEELPELIDDLSDKDHYDLFNAANRQEAI